MVQPIKADAEDTALDDLIRSLQRLRADEIVADKGADLETVRPGFHRSCNGVSRRKYR